MRVEHFVVAERQGQCAAENMLGARRRYDDIPFFWTAQYGKEFRYAGHASAATNAVVAGDIRREDAIVAYRENGRDVAFATFGRDLACLQAERALEVNDTKVMKELTAS